MAFPLLQITRPDGLRPYMHTYGREALFSRNELKNVLGGRVYTCYAVKADGSNGTAVSMAGDNAEQAQANADARAYSNQFSSYYPYGINCPGAIE